MAQVTYTVKKGDTLSAIAKTHNTTVSALVKLNNIPDANKIYVGQVLVISGNAVTETKTTTSYPTGVTVGLQADTDRTLIARWDWSKANTDHYLVRWWWGAAEKDIGDGILAVEDQQVSTSWRGHVWTAPENASRVSFYVKPVSKTYTVNNKEASYWTADYSKKVTYYFSDNPPLKPDVPSVKLDGTKLTVTLDNLQDLNAESIQFHVYQDNAHLVAEATVDIVTYHVSHTFTVEPGHEYKVQCRSWRGDLHSDWSSYTDNQETAPAAPGGITKCRANSSTSVLLEWESVSNAKTYDIEYATKREYFDGSDQTTTVSSISTTQYIKTGLESGNEYFFRVRAVNSQGTSPWSDIVSIILGKAPSAPTTWSSTTTAVSGEPLYLYWTHNSEDGSKQMRAELELTIDGTTEPPIVITNPTFDDDEAEEKTSSYEFDTSAYLEGTTLKWRVRTCGITEEYGDWSIQRQVDIYGPPTLAFNLYDSNDALLETLTGFPFRANAIAGPSTQTAIGYYLSITANTSYESVDQIGNPTIVTKNGEVYGKYFDINGDLDVTLSANDIDLANNITYTATCTVTMNSGLTTEDSRQFTVAWDDLIYEPNASIAVDTESFSTIIRPYCDDADGNLIDDITLSVYRREYNGGFTEIATGIENNGYTYVTDPHPALDYARYRIVAIVGATGAVSYCDLAGIPIGESAIVLQWDERWTNFDPTNDPGSELHPWSGSLLRLPYNIKVSNNHQPDVALVEYIGRKHPVSYYGTQLGETASWSTVIPKTDIDTLYALRRLAAWTGDVYVREPSGSGYWANIVVSFNHGYDDLTIPITFDIKRVEGGM